MKNTRSNTKKFALKKKHIFFFSILVLIFIIFFVYSYVKDESPVYIFDYSGYFESFKNIGSIFKLSKMEYIRQIISTIRNSDYNFSSLILALPFYLLLGGSRFSYILSMSILYLFPSILLSTYLIMNIIKSKNKISNREEIIYTFFTMILLLLYTRYWSPTLRGLPDICGIVPIAISYWYVKKHPLIEKQKYIYPFILGIIVYLPFLFRRWYVYYVIGFFLSNLIIDLYTFSQAKKDKIEIFITAFKNYLLAGMTTVISVILLQYPLVKNIIGTNYSSAYSGYQGSLIDHMYRFYNEFGLVIIILAALGIILSFVRKKYRKDSLFCLLNIALFWFFFSRVQLLGVHHFLGLSLWMIILVMIGIRHIYEIIKTDKCKNIWLIFIICLFSVNFITTYITRDKTIPLVSQKNTYYKFQYQNFDELQKLINDIEILVKDNDKTSDNTKFTVISESENISDNLIDLLGNTDIKDNVIYSNHIDSREGINFNSLMVKYAVVTETCQHGSSETGQQTICIPNDSIKNGTGIGQAYKLVSGPYIVQNNLKVYIYEKTRDFTSEEIDEYFNQFYQKYPNWKSEYPELDKIILESNIKLGSNYGAFKIIDNNTLYFFPGYTDTILTMPNNKRMKEMSFKIYTKNKNSNLNLSIICNGEQKFSSSIVYGDTKNISIDTSNIDEIKIVVNSGDELSNDDVYVEIK